MRPGPPTEQKKLTPRHWRRGKATRTSVQKRRPVSGGLDWRRPHHSPLFWLGVVLFLAAIAYYLWSQDLSTRPHA
jgi:hypothetical protein